MIVRGYSQSRNGPAFFCDLQPFNLASACIFVDENNGCFVIETRHCCKLAIKAETECRNDPDVGCFPAVEFAQLSSCFSIKDLYSLIVDLVPIIAGGKNVVIMSGGCVNTFHGEIRESAVAAVGTEVRSTSFSQQIAFLNAHGSASYRVPDLGYYIFQKQSTRNDVTTIGTHAHCITERKLFVSNSAKSFDRVGDVFG